MFSDVSSALGRPARKVKKLMGISRSSCAGTTREDMCTWSVAEVGEWLHHTGISALTAAFFAGRGIDGSALLHLTLNELVCMELPYDDVGRMYKAIVKLGAMIPACTDVLTGGGAEVSEMAAVEGDAHPVEEVELAQQHNTHNVNQKEDADVAHDDLRTPQSEIRELRQQLEASRVACQKALRKQAAAQGWVKDLTSENRSLKEHLARAETSVREMEASRGEALTALKEEVGAARMQSRAATDEIASVKTRLAAVESSAGRLQASLAGTNNGLVKVSKVTSSNCEFLEARVEQLEAALREVKSSRVAAQKCAGALPRSSTDEDASRKKMPGLSERFMNRRKIPMRLGSYGSYTCTEHCLFFSEQILRELPRCRLEDIHLACREDIMKACGLPAEHVVIDILFDEGGHMYLDCVLFHNSDATELLVGLYNYGCPSVRKLCDGACQRR